MTTLACFTTDELRTAHRLLAGRVASMMGRKFEEEDWRQAYAGAKGIPDAGWSNLQIDVMHGSLGVEHKMLRVRSKGSILTACGTSMMHPAGTRSIRIPQIEDATAAARDILQQYGALIEARTTLVRVRSQLGGGQLERSEAEQQLAEELGLNITVARRQLADVEVEDDPTDVPPPDMRFGWLLWQDSLREFLYFEQPMTVPDPSAYRAIWVESGGGSRKQSRNLWIYDIETDRKAYSITTEAGAKIQPYFDVPPPDDENLCHFVVQGEVLGNGYVRMWLTEQTAWLLEQVAGTMEPAALSAAILRGCEAHELVPNEEAAFADSVVEVLITTEAYRLLAITYDGVSDEHLAQLCARTLQEVADGAGSRET